MRRGKEALIEIPRDLCILLHKNSIFVGKVNTVPGNKRLYLECSASQKKKKDSSIITEALVGH